MHFEFATATRIVFGPGAIREIDSIVAGLGTRALVLTGRSAARSAPVFEQLEHAAIETVGFSVTGEPMTGLVSFPFSVISQAGASAVGSVVPARPLRPPS